MAEANEIIVNHFSDSRFGDAFIEYIEKIKSEECGESGAIRRDDALTQAATLIRRDERALTYSNLITNVRLLMRAGEKRLYKK